MIRASALLRRLGGNASGVAMTEFALSVPFLLTVGLWGTETANYAVTNMQVSQLAIHVADNGARIGDTSSLASRKIYESDINDLLIGADLQAKGLQFFARGRAIISSLEVDSGGRQYIHWQRCRGAKSWPSSYGVAGDGIATSIAGIGPAGNQVSAPVGGAVIFVELAYDYRPLVSQRFVNSGTIKATAAFVVRDNRDLTQIYQRNTSSPDPVASCGIYSS